MTPIDRGQSNSFVLPATSKNETNALLFRRRRRRRKRLFLRLALTGETLHPAESFCSCCFICCVCIQQRTAGRLESVELNAIFDLWFDGSSTHGSYRDGTSVQSFIRKTGKADRKSNLRHLDQYSCVNHYIATALVNATCCRV